MKYIVLEAVISPTAKMEIPIIFPSILVHKDVADRMCQLLGMEHGWMAKPIAAGEVSSVGLDSCYGESTTLKLKSRGAKDDRLLSMNDYGVGHV